MVCIENALVIEHTKIANISVVSHTPPQLFLLLQ